MTLSRRAHPRIKHPIMKRSLLINKRQRSFNACVALSITKGFWFRANRSQDGAIALPAQIGVMRSRLLFGLRCEAAKLLIRQRLAFVFSIIVKTDAGFSPQIALLDHVFEQKRRFEVR